jgi:hypothetical protein
MPLTDSDSEYRDSTNEEPDSDGHKGASSGPLTTIRHRTRRLANPEDVVTSLQRNVDDITLMSPYFSIVGILPCEYDPLACYISY